MIVKAKENPLDTKAHKIICDLNRDVLDKLCILFRTAHALAYNNRPFTDYNMLCQLDQSKGLNVGKSYLNNNTGKQFTIAIAEVERRRLAEVIDRVKYVSVLS